MLLNVAPTPSTHAGAVPATDGAAEVARAAASTVTPPTGRALLAALEHQAQRELAEMAATTAAADPCPDPAFAALAWDLGLSGDDVAATESPNAT
ncbi:hypothetical protein [Stenotrophomonas sp.]|uniref:hypothetical protein n=1 Tax=Stenotrophomonas sp. TaxID=69392 RepID=UPI0028B1FBC0|nr:hypothetical protein [Stenotrophomonas sp.]